jgi:hypothetical protein
MKVRMVYDMHARGNATSVLKYLVPVSHKVINR